MTTATTTTATAATTEPRARFRRTLVSGIALAAWFGLLAGLLEGIATAALRGRPYHAIRASAEILWIAPAFNLLLFVLIGAVASVALYAAPARLRLTLLVTLLAWVLLFGVALFTARLHQIAALVLSLGLAIQIARSFRKRETSAMRFVHRTLAPLALIAIASALLGVAWEPLRERRALASLPPSPAAPQPNVLLLVLDTLRADRLGCYGYTRNTTPNIDRIAATGALFESAIANSSWTLPAQASMLTGRLPHEHGADWWIPLDGRFPALPETFSSLGYATAAFAANTSYVAPEWGLDRGFTRFETYGSSLADHAVRTVYGRKLALNILPRLGHYDIPGRKRADRVNHDFLRWLDRKPNDRPFFAMLNYFDVHDPYCTPHPHDPPFSDKPLRGDVINFQFQAEAFRRKPVLTPDETTAESDAYDDCLAYLDAQVGALIEDLRRRHLDQNTLVVITSDHGESLGNHDLYGHGQSLYIETLHVPLILSRPGHIPAGLRVRGVVGLHDLPATIASLAAPAQPHPFPGRTLERYFDNPTAPGDAVLARVNAGRLTGGHLNYPTARGGLSALVTDDAHLILSDSGRTELYAWRQDLTEAANLSESPDHQALLKSMRARLRELSGQSP